MKKILFLSLAGVFIFGASIAKASGDPIITSLAVANITSSSATINWTTNEPVKSTIKYGINERNYREGSDKIKNKNLVTSNSVILADLTPNTTYYYTLKVKDVTGNKTKSIKSSFITTLVASLAIEPYVANDGSDYYENAIHQTLWGFKFTVSNEPVHISSLKVGFNYNTFTGEPVSLAHGGIMINGVDSSNIATLFPTGTVYSTDFTVYPGSPVIIYPFADIKYENGAGFWGNIEVKLMPSTQNAEGVDSHVLLNVPSIEVPAGYVSGVRPDFI